jgi:hypothetical protein
VRRKEHLPRDNEGAALERVAHLTEENRRLQAELARRGPPAPQTGPTISRTARVLSIVGALIVVNAVLVPLVLFSKPEQPLSAQTGNAARRVSVQAETIRASQVRGLPRLHPGLDTPLQP